ncbi:uncharacterized protein LOC121904567 isoform X2 [Thunnus maccoyii]|uniref:uncharacterized protein LOC121904567 isoform X2 n=1 Tax=Thunnus maccoyii TaxID=8240 RepID=UPI001C4BA98A|nr:uncharacterized protein LOC121904567 isoform X2 [Thunnus maccoyii]
MGSPSTTTLDEVHCLWPLCSHTCCWEAEQRIHAGKPRMLKALTSCRASATAADDDRFPAVTVVNAADWTNAGSSTEVFSLKSEDNVSKAATDALISHVASPKGARRHVKPPQLHVKNLIFLPSPEMNKSIEIKKLKQDKARKRVLLKQTSLKSQLNQEGKGWLKVDTDPSDPGRSWPGPHSDLQVKKVPAAPQCHNLVPVGQTLVTAPEAKGNQQPPRSAQTLRPRKKQVVLQPVCEGMQKRHTRDEHRTFKHKLDMKAGIDGIDWESLKRQTYQWRRHILPAESSSLEDKAEHVPDSFHPAPILSSYYQSKSPSTTGAAKCQNKAYMNEIWQCCTVQLRGMKAPNEGFQHTVTGTLHKSL